MDRAGDSPLSPGKKRPGSRSPPEGRGRRKTVYLCSIFSFLFVYFPLFGRGSHRLRRGRTAGPVSIFLSFHPPENGRPLERPALLFSPVCLWGQGSRASGLRSCGESRLPSDHSPGASLRGVPRKAPPFYSESRPIPGRGPGGKAADRQAGRLLPPGQLPLRWQNGTPGGGSGFASACRGGGGFLCFGSRPKAS